MYQMTTNYTLHMCGYKIYQTAIIYTNILHTKALQNIPKLGFSVCTYANIQSGNPARVVVKKQSIGIYICSYVAGGVSVRAI
jgi:hypothetical protein